MRLLFLSKARLCPFSTQNPSLDPPFRSAKSQRGTHEAIYNNPSTLLTWFHLYNSFCLSLHSWSTGLLLFLKSLTLTQILPSLGHFDYSWLLGLAYLAPPIPFTLLVLLLPLPLITFHHATKCTFYVYCLLSVFSC